MGGLLAKLRESFAKKKLEMVIVGLENSGKTTLVNLLALGKVVETTPTVGLKRVDVDEQTLILYRSG